MTTAEESRLAELETVVETGLDTFLQVGLALAEIQRAKLYRQTHHSFDRYLADRFPRIRRAHAYRLVSAASTVRELSSMGDIPLPANERQARELSGLDTRTAADVMVATVAEVGEKPTAADIARTRDRIARDTDDDTAALYGVRLADPIYALDEHQFEEALTAARADGDLSAEHVNAVATAMLTRAKTSTRRRTPLPEAVRRATFDLTKGAERLTRLAEDHRFPGHAAALAVRRGDLARVRDAIQRVLDLLPEGDGAR